MWYHFFSILQKVLFGSADYSLSVNTRMQSELNGGSSAQKVREFLLVLALCNTVIVARHPHHDSVSTVLFLLVAYLFHS